MEVVFQFLTIISNYSAAYVKSKITSIKFKVAAATFNACAIISVGNGIESLPVFFTIIRNITCLNKEKFKSNKPIYLVLLGYMCLGVYTFISTGSVMSLLPTIASLSASIVLWFANNKGMKIWLSVVETVWVVYYIYAKLYFSALNTTLQIIVALISLVRIIRDDRKQLSKV